MRGASTVHIDVGAILHASHKGAYTDLVTRATGRTVRTTIETQMASRNPGTVAVIDFSSVGLLDFSCADEIVATLMRQCCADSPAFDGYLLFSGIRDAHLDAIEHVLERHRLALVVRFTGLGAVQLIGMVDEGERLIWEYVAHAQRVTAISLAASMGLNEEIVADHLATLHRRRLLIREGSAYRAPLGAVA